MMQYFVRLFHRSELILPEELRDNENRNLVMHLAQVSKNLHRPSRLGSRSHKTPSFLRLTSVEAVSRPRMRLYREESAYKIFDQLE
jgi:hypothetical protein